MPSSDDDSVDEQNPRKGLDKEKKKSGRKPGSKLRLYSPLEISTAFDFLLSTRPPNASGKEFLKLLQKVMHEKTQVERTTTALQSFITKTLRERIPEEYHKKFSGDRQPTENEAFYLREFMKETGWEPPGSKSRNKKKKNEKLNPAGKGTEENEQEKETEGELKNPRASLGVSSSSGKSLKMFFDPIPAATQKEEIKQGTQVPEGKPINFSLKKTATKSMILDPDMFGLLGTSNFRFTPRGSSTPRGPLQVVKGLSSCRTATSTEVVDEGLAAGPITSAPAVHVSRNEGRDTNLFRDMLEKRFSEFEERTMREVHKVCHEQVKRLCEEGGFRMMRHKRIKTEPVEVITIQDSADEHENMKHVEEVELRQDGMNLRDGGGDGQKETVTEDVEENMEHVEEIELRQEGENQRDDGGDGQKETVTEDDEENMEHEEAGEMRHDQIDDEGEANKEKKNEGESTRDEPSSNGQSLMTLLNDSSDQQLVLAAADRDVEERANSFSMSPLRARFSTVTLVEVYDVTSTSGRDASGVDRDPFHVIEEKNGDLSICHSSVLDKSNWSKEVVIDQHNTTLEEEMQCVRKGDILDLCSDGQALSPMSLTKITPKSSKFNVTTIESKGRVVRALFKRRDK